MVNAAELELKTKELELKENEQILHWSAHQHYWVRNNWSIEKPHGIYAGIGTRDLNDFGKAFIDQIYDQ